MEKLKVRVNDLHKYYGKLEVLKGIDMTVNQGEVVSLIGPSGSGKSTFLRCINLLETPTRGSVLLMETKPPIKKQILISCVGILAWYFSILIYFLI